jgi:hypothetical protein
MVRKGSSRLPTVLLLASLAVLGLPASAAANWQPPGTGSAFSRAGAMAGGNTPTASASGRNVTVSWSASGGAVPVDGYRLSRYDSGNQAHSPGSACSGTVSGLVCKEIGVAPGQWTYTVTPVRSNWRGGESSKSAPVTVAAPSLALSPGVVNALPATLTGQIAGFVEGQTVSFRLDDPASGQVLFGSILPTPVQASGAASVTVTVPAGTPDGSHTIYAIGSQGDVAGTAVKVEAACSAPGPQTIPASRDSYVDSLLIGQNFGTAGTLEVGPSYLVVLSQQRALVGFELPAVPARCTLKTAQLRLYAAKPGSGRTIEALRLSGAWTETGVTWSNQPATIGSAATSASLSTAGWQQWNVLSQVEGMYSGANNGFLVKDSVANGVLPPHQAYQSHEATPDGQDPQLVLGFE